MTAVMRPAEARRRASRMMKSSIRFSLTGWQVGWMTKQSWPRMESWILTSISPSENRFRRGSVRGTPTSSEIKLASSGLALPGISLSSPQGEASSLANSTAVWSLPIILPPFSLPPRGFGRSLPPRGRGFRRSLPHRRIAQIGHVGYLAAPADAGANELCEAFDVDLLAHRGARPELREGPAVRPVPDLRVPDLDEGPDATVASDPGLALQHREGLQHGVLTDLDSHVHEGAARVDDRHPRQHQTLQQAPAQRGLSSRQLHEVVDPERL